MARDIPFSELTTLRVGGPADRLVTAATQRDLVDLALEAWSNGGPWLVLGGGSNLLVGDEGFDGTVIRVATRASRCCRRVRQPGHPCAFACRPARRGTTSSRGPSSTDSRASRRSRAFPGSVGAAPVQNIGAYGQELESTLVAIEFLDEGAEAPRRMTADELELGYRTSVLEARPARHRRVGRVRPARHRERARVLGDALGGPIAYAQLADALRGEPRRSGSDRTGARERAGASRVQGHGARPGRSRLGERRLVLHQSDHHRARRRDPSRDAPRWYLVEDAPDEVTPLAGGGAEESPLDQFLAHQASLAAGDAVADAAPAEPLVKLSAAWLIERSGIRRGFALPGSRAAISSKHTLALTNRGGASAEEVAQLARFVQSRVQAEFGIMLHPEPVLVGVEL